MVTDSHSIRWLSYAYPEIINFNSRCQMKMVVNGMSEIWVQDIFNANN